MVDLKVASGPTNGLFIADRFSNMTVATGDTATIGKVMVASKSATSTAYPDQVRDGAGGDQDNGMVGVVVDLYDGAGAASTTVKMQWSGRVEADIQGALTFDEMIAFDQANNAFDQAATAGEKVLGMALTTAAGGSATVMFDGINGVGTV